MFNKIYIAKHSTEYVPYEKTIIEKRAPTDDSIRLYEEIKEKAYKSILKTISVNDNIINFSAIITKDTSSYDKICRYKIIINGREITGKINITDLEYNDQKLNIYRKIYEEAVKGIAENIMMMAVKERL